MNPPDKLGQSARLVRCHHGRGIAVSYDRVATILSLGQDPRWRRAIVDAIDARPTDPVLDVATGTGMVAQALHDR